MQFHKEAGKRTSVGKEGPPLVRPDEGAHVTGPAVPLSGLEAPASAADGGREGPGIARVDGDGKGKVDGAG